MFRNLLRDQYRTAGDWFIGLIGLFFLFCGIVLLVGLCFEIYHSDKREQQRVREINSASLHLPNANLNR